MQTLAALYATPSSNPPPPSSRPLGHRICRHLVPHRRFPGDSGWIVAMLPHQEPDKLAQHPTTALLKPHGQDHHRMHALVAGDVPLCQARRSHVRCTGVKVLEAAVRDELHRCVEPCWGRVPRVIAADGESWAGEGGSPSAPPASGPPT
jgi:hypothetical protein